MSRRKTSEFLQFDYEIEVTCCHNNTRRRLHLEDMVNDQGGSFNARLLQELQAQMEEIKDEMNRNEKLIKKYFQLVTVQRPVLGPVI